MNRALANFFGLIKKGYLKIESLTPNVENIEAISMLFRTVLENEVPLLGAFRALNCFYVVISGVDLARQGKNFYHLFKSKDADKSASYNQIFQRSISSLSTLVWSTGGVCLFTNRVMHWGDLASKNDALIEAAVIMVVVASALKTIALVFKGLQLYGAKQILQSYNKTSTYEVKNGCVGKGPGKIDLNLYGGFSGKNISGEELHALHEKAVEKFYMEVAENIAGWLIAGLFLADTPYREILIGDNFLLKIDQILFLSTFIYIVTTIRKLQLENKHKKKFPKKVEAQANTQSTT